MKLKGLTIQGHMTFQGRTSFEEELVLERGYAPKLPSVVADLAPRVAELSHNWLGIFKVDTERT